MSSNILILQAAVNRFKAAHRLDTEYQDTFPHVLEGTIEPAIEGNEVVVWHWVTNGQTTERQGSIYLLSDFQ